VKRAVIVRASFVADLKTQVAWLRANERPERVVGLRSGLAEARTLLARFPEAGTRVEERDGVVLRKLVLRKLPFAIWYVVGHDGVHLLRLFHVRQDRPRRRPARR
jgi:plasmid stabilization system protein ParE